MNKILSVMLMMQAIAIAVCTASITVASIVYGVEAVTVIMVDVIGATLCIASAIISCKIARL